MEKIKQKKFVRAKDVISRLSIGKSTLYRYLKNGDFPKPYAKLSKCCTVWLESDIDQYIEDQALTNTDQNPFEDIEGVTR